MKFFILVILFFSMNLKAETKEKIIDQIVNVSVDCGLDPDVAVAIAKVESSLNPNAVGSLGEIGLFQLRPEYHNVIKGNTKHNTKVAVRYLRELEMKFSEKYGNAWFVLYNWGPYNPPKKPTETKYYKKVMIEVNKLRVSRYLAVK